MTRIGRFGLACKEEIMSEDKIIITISGKDKVGIVAKIANTLADLSVNIEDIKQTIMQDYFVMMMLCSIKDADKSFKEIKEGIINSGKEIDMEVWVQRKEIFDSMHSV